MMASSEQATKRAAMRRAAILFALGVALALTNRFSTFVDDETSIIRGAARPAAEIVRAYLAGFGMHEHPPLYDLLLHAWG